jgi:hypothetical protein
MDWIRVIELLDLRLHRIVIYPHYGDTTDDGTPAGQNRHQQGAVREDLKEMVNANQEKSDANLKELKENIKTKQAKMYVEEMREEIKSG